MTVPRPFAVWAPKPGRVDLVLDGVDHAMVRGSDGWWRADAPAAIGARYGFRVDGGEARPDPRSVAQPDGIDGLSAVFDPSAFDWRDHGWRGRGLRGAVIYELHVGTFSSDGTFDGAIDHLDHLVALGVDFVELLPIATASGRHGWGYDGVDLYAVHDAYGGPDGLQRFVDACHAEGIGVLIDVVYNHLGPAGNHLAELGPYFTDRHQTPWGDAINYDGDDASEVRRWVVDNALLWLRDFHADGLRLDAVHAIVDESERHIVGELVDEVRALERELGRRFVVIAELEGGNAPPEWGLDAVWFDDWHHALHVLLTGERDGYYAGFGSWTALTTALRGPSSPERHVVCAQNHDQIGNRARGERLSMLVPPEQLGAVAELLLTSPFVVLLFQGEEWGATTPFLYFTDHADAALGSAVRDGRRAEFAAFGWDPDDVPDPQDPATFASSKLDWSEIEREPHASLLRWYRELVVRRRAGLVCDRG